MFKVSSDKLIRIVKALEASNNAINILERANKNHILFSNVKNEITNLAEEITSQYGLKEFNDFKDNGESEG
jgi:hypothetical protein